MGYEKAIAQGIGLHPAQILQHDFHILGIVKFVVFRQTADGVIEVLIAVFEVFFHIAPV